MCISINLPAGSGKPADQVDVPIVVETLRYESANRKVLIAFDLIVRNRAHQPAFLYLTHADNVEGRLATEDWFPPTGSESDDRMRLMQDVYGPHWQIHRVERRLTYTDPIQGGLGPASDLGPVLALALSSRLGSDPSAGAEIDPRLIEPSPDEYGTWRLKRHPKDDCPPNQEFRPYSTFRLGPFPQQSVVFARVTVVIQGEAYNRLVQPDPEHDGPFSVVSAPRVLRQIHYAGLPDFSQEPDYADYLDFFKKEIEPGVLTPQRYHIIIAQPTEEDRDFRPDNQMVQFRPASSAISELYIPDAKARSRALWFNAWSPDFRLILRYQGHQRRPSRADFGRPLSQDVGA